MGLSSPASKLLRKFLSSETGLDVFDPANGSLLATVTDMRPDEVERIIDTAHQGFPAWVGMTAKERGRRLLAFYHLILDHSEELAAIVTAECGKPLKEAETEVSYAASFIEWFAEEGKRTYGDITPHHAPGKRILTLKQPIGVAAAITPWNFPLAMITRKIGPALAAGCPIIVKPSEVTPLSALYLEVLAHEAGIPEDIFRVVTTTTPAEIGTIIAENPLIRKLSFTGSTRVGKLLLRQCAGTVKRVSMELGGNAPFIVFDDADIDAAIEGALASKYRNAGQTCVCSNRFLVQSGIYDAFAARLAERVSQFRTGPGSEPDTTIGPLINAAALSKVRQLVDSAIRDGATAVTGGTPHNAGANFFTPTVLSNVTVDMDIANNEIFGPVAPLIRFDTEADAIRMANDTPYGLAAYFYTRDHTRIWRVMETLEYGMVGVNDGAISTEVAPFGGVKESGLGREGSRYGIDEYMDLKYCLMGGLESAH